MVNIGLNPGAMLGVVLFGAGAGLYFLRSVRPELARDHDIFFMAVAVLSGGILFFQGWRLDPILTFGQFLLTGSAIFFAVESIRLRGLATSRAKQNTPIVDEDRPVSRAYTYDGYEGYDPRLDRLEPDEDPRPQRMIGTKEDRYSQGERYEEDYPRRSSSSRRRSSSRPPAASSSSGRRPSRRPSGTTSRGSEDWETSSYRSVGYEDPYGPMDMDDERSYGRPPESRDSRPPSEPRRPRPPESDNATYRDRRPPEPPREDYVDFEPLDDLKSDRPNDEPGNFDY
ncbi:Ycf66 family protein [Roseofilum sp. Belize Diploria]|uniref:Ycf66 family protein n=1 Tax=Roseofilum sp. Belize Diploria TaxID=2821501 RepID=UPI001B0AEA62|nr:Ycf66 family protein [Roseofilum sp. Belize Diploria]MBP0009465.1 Ycf66 family protein [Roseofilum sp. Belize Diploria]